MHRCHSSQKRSLQKGWNTSKKHALSNKVRNKKVKQTNGNGRKSLVIAHWNLGSKKWQNKTTAIQALVDSKKPDIIFISEANLHEGTPDHETLILGYNLHKPLTAATHGVSRIVLLAKENLDFKIENHLMNDLVASMWLKFTQPGNSSILVCGVYREHRLLNQKDDQSNRPEEQLNRWNSFLEQVVRARSSSSVHIIGDFNLDFRKWASPDGHHINLVNNTKNILEAGGYSQLVVGITRTWPGQVDSLIDHLWSNNSQRIISCTNEVRATGDHNLLTAIIRTKGQDSRRLDARRRSYKNFDPVIYRNRLAEVDWNKDL